MNFRPMLLLLTFAVSACGAGAGRVDVSGSSRDLHLAAIAAEGEEPVCIKTASVSQAEPEDAAAVWQVTTLHSDKCVSGIDYGHETAELAQEAPAATLRPNVPYRVRMSGGGFSLTRDFRISPAGEITVID